MRSDTLALMDRLHAVLRETDNYLPTREIGKRAGDAWIEFAHNPAFHDDKRFSHCLAGRCYLRVGLSNHPRTWRLLTMMEKQGLVFRAEVEGQRQVYWAYVEDFALNPLPIEDLEAAWEMEAPDRG